MILVRKVRTDGCGPSGGAGSGRRAGPVLLSIVALLASALVGCNPLEELRARLRIGSLTPREAYELALESAGLSGTALVREWSEAAARALDAAARIDAPFQETGYLAPERPTAVGYRVAARRGQRVSVSVRLEGDTAALLFLDVFRVPADPLERPFHLVSADSGRSGLDFEPHRDGEYLIRVQPELLRGGRYTLEIYHDPTLAFPVAGATNRSIMSGFGASRDGGRRRHHGIDIFAPRGTPVIAVTEARVWRVGQTELGGKVVWLRDEERGYRIYYAHLDTQMVSNGMLVRPGDTVGRVGNTGNARRTRPHLHFGVYVRGEGPVDPMAFVRQTSRSAPELRVDPSLIGDWTRAARDSIEMRASPRADGTLLGELPRHTAMFVLAGAGAWYRIELPDGRMGFVAGDLIEDADRPLRKEVLAEGRAMHHRPHNAAIAIDSVPAGRPVEVLGRFGDFLYVQTPARKAGWLSLD